MPGCCVVSCKNRIYVKRHAKLNAQGKSFFRVTDKRREQWNDILLGIASSTNTICSDHFTKDCIDTVKRRPRLKATAVPTIFYQDVNKADDLSVELAEPNETVYLRDNISINMDDVVELDSDNDPLETINMNDDLLAVPCDSCTLKFNSDNRTMQTRNMNAIAVITLEVNSDKSRLQTRNMNDNAIAVSTLEINSDNSLLQTRNINDSAIAGSTLEVDSDNSPIQTGKSTTSRSTSPMIEATLEDTRSFSPVRNILLAEIDTWKLLYSKKNRQLRQLKNRHEKKFANLYEVINTLTKKNFELQEEANLREN